MAKQTFVDGFPMSAYVHAQKLDSNFTEIYDSKITQNERDKLEGIEEGAEVNTQSDFSSIDDTSDSFIVNKPSSFGIESSFSVTNDAEAAAVNLKTIHGNGNIIELGLPTLPCKFTYLNAGGGAIFASSGGAVIASYTILEEGDVVHVIFDPDAGVWVIAHIGNYTWYTKEFTQDEKDWAALARTSAYTTAAFIGTSLTVPNDLANPLPITNLHSAMSRGVELDSDIFKNNSGRTIPMFSGDISFQPHLNEAAVNRIIVFVERSTDNGATWNVDTYSGVSCELNKSGESSLTKGFGILDLADGEWFRFCICNDGQSTVTLAKIVDTVRGSQTLETMAFKVKMFETNIEI